MKVETTTPCLGCRRITRSRFCRGCFARTDEHLAAIPGLYSRLDLVMQLGPTGYDPVSGTRVSPSPARMEPLTLRANGGIVSTLTCWEADWRDILGWTTVPFRGSVEQRVEGSARFLLANWAWCADAHPAADEFASEIADLVHACRLQVDGPSEARRIGRCPTRLDDGGVCGAKLSADPAADAVTCRACRTCWPRRSWLSLGELIREAGAA